MVVVRHDSIGADVDGEDIRQLPQTGDDPGLAVFVVLTGKGILAPQKSAAYTAADAVIVRGDIE
jgi:hypothetical protein